MTDMLKNCQPVSARLRRRPHKEPRSLRCRHRKSKLHALRFICGRSRRFRVQMARARCFSLLLARLCVLPKPQDQPQRGRGTEHYGRMHWRKPFLSLEKKVRITSTLLPAPIMCPQIIEALQIARKTGAFAFLLYTIPADMSRWKRWQPARWSH